MPIPASEMVKMQYSSFDNNMMLRKVNNGQNLINCELLINQINNDLPCIGTGSNRTKVTQIFRT